MNLLYFLSSQKIQGLSSNLEMGDRYPGYPDRHPMSSSKETNDNSTENDDDNDLFDTDFGQKVDLSARIREILRNYPEGKF